MRRDAATDSARWNEILRRTGIALAGRPVVLLDSSNDEIRSLASHQVREPRDVPLAELGAAIRVWNKHQLPAGTRWVATRLRGGHWCAAPVRRAAGKPPPGTERRSAERMTLELAGLCIGLLEPSARDLAATAAPAAASAREQILATQLVDQLPALIWTTDTMFRVTARMGATARAFANQSARAPGVAPLVARDNLLTTPESLAAHRQALAGKSATYPIQFGAREFEALVQPLLTEHGSIGGVLGIAIDVTDRERALDDAEKSRLELEDFFEQAAVGMHWAAVDGTILRANQAELDMLGYTRGEYVGHNVAEFYEDPAVAGDTLKRLRAGETLVNIEVRLKRRDGTLRDGLLSSNARFEQGQFIHTRCVTRDITDRKRAEEALARLRAIVDSADDAIIGKTLDGIVTTWNPGAERLYGYMAAEMIGHSVAILVPPENPGELEDILARIRRGERVSHYETVRVRKDGTHVDVSETVSPIFDAAGAPVGASAIARDVTEQRRVEDQLLHGATHDPLTDLPNRTYFVEHVAQAMERTRKDPEYKFAVLFLDFDKFKVVNDSLGHAAGDTLLREIAVRLRSVVRPSDLVARFGGDEFTLLLEGVTTQSDIERSTRRIYETFTAPFTLEGQLVYVTTSIGVALSTKDFARPEDLLRDADLAMYRAKSRGRGRFQIFDAEMLQHAHERFGTEKDLRAALERGDFRLAYQPIVELRTGRVHAFEALLRWHHPERGIVMPLEFIPVAEETGLIVPMGLWVLHEACAQARRWRRFSPDGRPARISVNLSARQLGDAHIVDDVRNALRQERLDARCLRLEITETVLIDTVEASTDRLRQLDRLGVELHMDDFGTGYSSLSLLPRFPLQTLKIDRSFVHRLGARRSDQELVRSIVDLTHRLGMDMIAEGVETTVQRERLISFGCEFGQGFLFAKGLDPDAAGAMLKANARRPQATS